MPSLKIKLLLLNHCDRDSFVSVDETEEEGDCSLGQYIKNTTTSHFCFKTSTLLQSERYTYHSNAAHQDGTALCQVTIFYPVKHIVILSDTTQRTTSRMLGWI